MILREAQLVPTRDVTRYAWDGLRRFQNVQFVEEQIRTLQLLDHTHRQNIRKQATQIRYVLTQAEEYFNASLSVSLATKPTLLYYSIMSLAIAEILLKQSGDSSLDRAREQHRHHGLDFVAANERDDQQLINIKAAALSLSAKPTTRKAGERMGTFELWHRSCRNTPICGMFHVREPGGWRNSFGCGITYPDERLPLIPNRGITFYECLCALPGMYDFILQYGLIPELVRGVSTMNMPFGPQGKIFHRLVINPSPQDEVNLFFDEGIKVRAEEVDRINHTKFSEGGVLDYEFDPIQSSPDAFLDMPQSAMWTKSDIRFWPKIRPLNEFAYIYLSLFILGNYARYYPDKWLLHIDQHSPLVSATEELVNIIERRMVLLSYSGNVACLLGAR
jgi:hypothetical protein